MFWWLMAPFIGRNLDEARKATAELREATTDHGIRRCAELAHDNETRAVMRAVDTAKELFRSGFYGSTVRDEIEIAQLKQTVAILTKITEVQAEALDQLRWQEEQERR